MAASVAFAGPGAPTAVERAKTSMQAALDLLRDPASGLVRDRRWRLRKYKQCFEATETVGRLVADGRAASRKDAVAALRRAVESGLVQHVAAQHHFEDAYLFFRLLEPNDDSADSTSVGLPSLAAARDAAAKVGSAKVKTSGFTQSRYLVLVNGTLLVFKSEHVSRPMLALPLTECQSGSVSSCGQLSTGAFGVSISPPICERNDGASDSHADASGEGKQSIAETSGSDGHHVQYVVLLLKSAKDQESWLHALVKAGLRFEETSPTAAMASRATSLHEFKTMALDGTPLDLAEVCNNKVVVVVNVASF